MISGDDCFSVLVSRGGDFSQLLFKVFSLPRERENDVLSATNGLRSVWREWLPEISPVGGLMEIPFSV